MSFPLLPLIPNILLYMFSEELQPEIVFVENDNFLLLDKKVAQLDEIKTPFLRFNFSAVPEN